MSGKSPSHAASETILHCDLNSFYASVECVFRPELKSVPMAVAGNPENRHGIILAKNEPAKKFSISTGESVWNAKRKCPNLVLVPPRHGKYSEYSRMVNAIYARFTNRVEPFGIDESWLDVSACGKLFGTPIEIADTIRKTVREELGLTVSIGVSFNKVFAKFGSDYKKPDATTLISLENFKDIVFPQSVSNLLFVGRKTAEALRKIGIRTIGELANANPNIISSKFGKHGEFIYEAANGRAETEVGFYGDEREAKSVGNSITYKRDLRGESDFKAAIRDLSETVSARLKSDRLLCSVVNVVIKDPDFRTITRQKKISSPTDLADEIFDVAIMLVDEQWGFDEPVRMFGITAAGVSQKLGSPRQMSLFGDELREKNAKIQNATETIRNKYGQSAIMRANVAFSDIFSEEDLPPSSLSKKSTPPRKDL